MEECLELASAIHKFRRAKSHEEGMNAIIDEVADVRIMMEQTKLLVDEEKVKERMDFKIARLKGRVGRGEHE